MALTAPDSLNLLPRTLDVLTLKILSRGALHGYGIAGNLKSRSGDVLQVGESSLYPALQRFGQRLGSCRMGSFRKQPESALLHAGCGRQEATPRGA
jgi:hypothetical protein